MLLKEMRELVEELNIYAHAYYMEDTSLISDYEYDKKYDRLKELEKVTGIILANSPTINVGSETVSELEKVEHDHPMLSLDKTKDINEVESFMNGLPGLAMLKMDGLTISVKYIDGKLVAAETRGNGIIGENVLHTANSFVNLPKEIPYKDEVVVDGEAVMEIHHYTYLKELKDIDLKKDGERKGLFGEELEKYIKDNGIKNIRNLTAGSVRQLDNSVTKERKIKFIAWKAVRGIDGNSFMKRLQILDLLGFEVVPWVKVDNIEENIKELRKTAREKDVPIDGIVFSYDDIDYSESLGNTSHHVRSQLAYKFADDKFETVIRDVEWSMGKTGQLTPVAVFDPVEIDDTIVERASLHNVSIFKSYELSVGDTITVYKANMIIPQIADNLTRSGVRDIPEACPVCGGQTEVRQLNDVKSLYCTNPDCQAKKIKSFTLFTSRDALNIAGLSEATLEKFIGVGMIHEYADIFHLDRHQEEIVEMDGFGQKSYDNLIAAAEKASHTTLPRMVYGLGVAGIGLANAKMICRHFKNDFEAMRHATVEELVEIDGIGEVLAQAWTAFFSDGKNNAIVDHLLAELTFEAGDEESSEGADEAFAGMNFVITGSLEHFKNRKELQELIERRGGKVTGSVTSKTNYLINNDVASSSSKNKKARELGVPILSEEEFLKL